MQNTEQTQQAAVTTQVMQPVLTQLKKRKPLRQSQPRSLPIQKPSESCATVDTAWRSKLRFKIAQVNQQNLHALKAMVPRCLQHDAGMHFEQEAEVHFEQEAEVHFEQEAEVHFEHDAEVHFEHDAEVHLEHDAEVHFEMDEDVDIEIDEEMFELVNFYMSSPRICEKQSTEHFPRPQNNTNHLVLEAPDWSTFVAGL
jgi:hypothetical protein